MTFATHASRYGPGVALAACPLIATLRWIAPEEAEPAAAALTVGGFHLVEIRLNVSPSVHESIRRLFRHLASEAAIRRGCTVMSSVEVGRVRKAAGNFSMMPQADPDVVRAARTARACLYDVGP